MSRHSSRWVLAVAGFISLVVLWGGSLGRTEQRAELAPPPKVKQQVPPKPEVLIEAELSRTTAQPGDLIRLTELVPVDREIKTGRIEHTVHIIGQWKFETNSLANLDPEDALYWKGQMVFDKWWGDVMAFGNKPFEYRVKNPRQEGLEREFQARQIGIYLIRARWKLEPSGEWIESQPVVLTVKPPLDKEGKPIIKKEWIDPIHWEHRPKEK